MVTAYIAVKANTGQADRVKADIVNLAGVVDCHIVAGDVDFIAKVEVDSPADVKEVVSTAIEEVLGVESTQTYMSMD